MRETPARGRRSQQEAALVYMEDLLLQLRRLAADEDHVLLTYMIEMATMEARDLRTGQSEDVRIRRIG